MKERRFCLRAGSWRTKFCSLVGWLRGFVVLICFVSLERGVRERGESGREEVVCVIGEVLLRLGCGGGSW